MSTDDQTRGENREAAVAGAVGTDTAPLLKEEYFHLQKTVEDFDQRGLTIKAWSVTASMAAIGASISHPKAAALCLVAAVASLSFWITEALWKGFQQSYYPRIRTIEKMFRTGQPLTDSPFQINAEWSITYHQSDIWRFLQIMFWPHVMVPHVIVVIAGPLAWWLSK